MGLQWHSRITNPPVSVGGGGLPPVVAPADAVEDAFDRGAGGDGAGDLLYGTTPDTQDNGEVWAAGVVEDGSVTSKEPETRTVAGGRWQQRSATGGEWAGVVDFLTANMTVTVDVYKGSRRASGDRCVALAQWDNTGDGSGHYAMLYHSGFAHRWFDNGSVSQLDLYTTAAGTYEDATATIQLVCDVDAETVQAILTNSADDVTLVAQSDPTPSTLANTLGGASIRTGDGTFAFENHILNVLIEETA